uniref:Uncharacterized protein n=1 Tax=Rhizophora mucronata TaxID=61149 RepID=A0A2P2J4H4_RHIMU
MLRLRAVPKSRREGEDDGVC